MLTHYLPNSVNTLLSKDTGGNVIIYLLKMTGFFGHERGWFGDRLKLKKMEEVSTRKRSYSIHHP